MSVPTVCPALPASCQLLLGSDDGDNVLTLTITDGGPGDADGVANGQIVDPGSIGVTDPDNIPPVISASATRADLTAYAAGSWTNQTLTVHFTCSDSGSGIASCPADQLFSEDGITPSVDGTATDNAGNTATASLGPIQIDKTAPMITVSATKADSTAYAAGSWTNQTVTVHFTCSDSGSGIASCPADQVFSADGITPSVGGTATDDAENTATVSLGPIQIDKTAPNITINGVTNGAVYTVGGVSIASCTATDNGSGVNANGCQISVSGGMPNGVGTFSYTENATDNAGNLATVNGSYRAVYRFDGFLQPINDTAHSQVCGAPCPVSIFKGGSTVPTKFQLKDINGNAVQANTLPLWVAPQMGSSTSASVDEGVYSDPATSGSTYKYSIPQYVYTWGTKGFTAGYYWRIGVTLDDGQTYYVYIGLR